jgi:hypothetical protein
MQGTRQWSKKTFHFSPEVSHPALVIVTRSKIRKFMYQFLMKKVFLVCTKVNRGLQKILNFVTV